MLYKDQCHLSGLIESGFKDNLIGSNINKDFYENIMLYTVIRRGDDKDKFEAFLKKHNLGYFGELIERAEERGIVDDILNFRTLVFLASSSISGQHRNEKRYSNLDYNTDQINVYYENVEKRLLNEFDYLSAVILFNYTDISKYIKEDIKLFEGIINSIKSEKVTFEESVFGISVCLFNIQFKLNKMKSEEEGKELKRIKKEFILLLDNLKYQLIENKQNMFIYFKMALMFAYVEEFKSSKNFKNKTNYKIFRAIYKFATKEVDFEKEKDVLKLLEINERHAALLNFLLVNIMENSYHPGFSLKELVKVNKNAMRRINERCVKLYCIDEEIDEISSCYIIRAYDNEYKALINRKNDSYYRSETYKKELFSSFFVNSDIKISPSNLEIFYNKFSDILNSRYVSDNISKWLVYTLEDGYKEKFSIFNKDLKTEIISHTLIESKNKEDFEKHYNTAREYEVDKTIFNRYRDIVKKGIGLKVLNAKNKEYFFEYYLDTEVLKVITSVLSDNEKVEYILDLLNNYKDEVNDIHLTSLAKAIITILKETKVKKMKDDKVKKEYYLLNDKFAKIDSSLKDNFNETRISYYAHVVSNLLDKEYLRVMEISDEEKIIIAKKISENLENFYPQNYFKEKHEIQFKLKDLVISNEELAKRIEEQRKRDIEFKIKACKTSENFQTVLYHVKSEEEKVVLNEMKDIFLEKLGFNEVDEVAVTVIKEKPIFSYPEDKIKESAPMAKEYLECIKIIAHLNNHRCFTEKEFNALVNQYILNNKVLFNEDFCSISEYLRKAQYLK